jgi:hypothetical protein
MHWLALAALLALPLLLTIALLVVYSLTSDTPRGPNDGWCLTLDPPYRRRIAKAQDEPERGEP